MTQTTTQSERTRALEFGKKRLDAARKIEAGGNWDELWENQAHPFVFQPGSCWTQCTEYAVDDFASEIGFWIDVLGFDVNAFGSKYAMFHPGDQSYFFSVVPAAAERKVTPPDAIRLGFMLDGIVELEAKLKERGIIFEEPVQPYGSPESSLLKGTFRTPAGISVDIWGMVAEEGAP